MSELPEAAPHQTLRLTPPGRTDAADAELEELLARAWPGRLRRLLGSLGCPLVALGAALLVHAIAEPLQAFGGRIGGGLLGGGIFLVLCFALLVVVNAVAVGARRGPQARLRERLGQAVFSEAVAGLQSEAAELDADQRGSVLLLQGTVGSPVRHCFSVRADVRTDSRPMQARLRWAFGPRLQFFGKPPPDLSAWRLGERVLGPEHTERLRSMLDLVDRGALGRSPGSGPIRGEGYLLPIGPMSTPLRFAFRVERPDPQGDAVATLLADLLTLTREVAELGEQPLGPLDRTH